MTQLLLNVVAHSLSGPPFLFSEMHFSVFVDTNLLAYTWCVLEDVEFDHWGIGGNAVTPEILQAVIEGQT